MIFTFNPEDEDHFLKRIYKIADNTILERIAEIELDYSLQEITNEINSRE